MSSGMQCTSVVVNLHVWQSSVLGLCKVVQHCHHLKVYHLLYSFNLAICSLLGSVATVTSSYDREILPHSTPLSKYVSLTACWLYSRPFTVGIIALGSFLWLPHEVLSTAPVPNVNPECQRVKNHAVAVASDLVCVLAHA